MGRKTQPWPRGTAGRSRQAQKEAPAEVDQAIAAALNDWDSLNFYRHLLWGLLLHVNTGRSDHSRTVYLEAKRATVDTSEGFARRPGALCVSRLKRIQR